MGILNSHVECQIFVYLLGPGGTGKSTLANIIKCLVGNERSYYYFKRSTHRQIWSLKHDRKKLILISDTEHYQGDLSLKAFLGGDSLQGVKHKVEVMRFYPSGLVLITEIPLWVRKIQRCHFKEGSSNNNGL
jgi:phage/plasmid-associated DNA primase